MKQALTKPSIVIALFKVGKFLYFFDKIVIVKTLK